MSETAIPGRWPKAFRAIAIENIALECGYSEDALRKALIDYGTTDGRYDDVGVVVAVREREQRLAAEAALSEAAQKRRHYDEVQARMMVDNLTLQRQLSEAQQERDGLRSTLVAVGRNMGCLFADEVSSEFLCHLAEESKHWDQQITQRGRRSP